MSVAGVVGAGLRAWRGALPHLPLLLILPVLVPTALQVIVPPSPNPSASQHLIGTIVSIFVFSIFSVGWIRTMILGPGSVDRFGLSFHRPLWMYIKVFLAVTGINVIAIIPFNALLVASMAEQTNQPPSPFIFALTVVIGVALIWVMVRLHLAFPAAALDAGSPIIEGWRLSRKRVWKLVAVSLLALLVCIPVMMIGMLPALPLIDFEPPAQGQPNFTDVPTEAFAWMNVVAMFVTSIGAAISAEFYRAAKAAGPR